MELTIALALSILSSVIAVSNFVLSRKDKAVKDAKDDAKETNVSLIDYRLNELDKKVQKVLDKLDNYDKEIKDLINDAITHHINEYHKEK